ncbi:MAG: hypothetical protein K0R40_2368 [Burkholderiales bacterium]|jgi:hypothetical protein|nr:hypothetical protein [Burkholderiales bacterium]
MLTERLGNRPPTGDRFYDRIASVRTSAMFSACPAGALSARRAGAHSISKAKAMRCPPPMHNNGHPIGASGAVLTTRLLHSMARDGA